MAPNRANTPTPARSAAFLVYGVTACSLYDGLDSHHARRVRAPAAPRAVEPGRRGACTGAVLTRSLPCAIASRLSLLTSKDTAVATPPV
eukprot:364165-Chlamydomonas_euryale.AAC.5